MADWNDTILTIELTLWQVLGRWFNPLARQYQVYIWIINLIMTHRISGL